jgi:hypothetical protein
MEQITHYSTFLKGILDTNPWIWHFIQVFFLFDFLAKIFIPKLKYKSINNVRYLFTHIVMLIIIYVHDEISIEGLCIWTIILLINTLIYLIFKFDNRYKIFLIWRFIETLLILVSIFTICDKLNTQNKIVLLLIWGYNLLLNFRIVINSIYFLNNSKIKKDEVNVFNNIYFSPIYIALIFIPFSWYIWVLAFLALFNNNIIEEPFPKYFIKNNRVVIDDINKIKIGKLSYWLSIFFMWYFEFSTTSFLFIGFFIYIISAYQNSRRKFSNSFEKYLSFSTVTGNYYILEKIIDKDLFLSLLQRINTNGMLVKQETLNQSLFYQPVQEVSKFILPNLGKWYDEVKERTQEKPENKNK